MERSLFWLPLPGCWPRDRGKRILQADCLDLFAASRPQTPAELILLIAGLRTSLAVGSCLRPKGPSASRLDESAP